MHSYDGSNDFKLILSTWPDTLFAAGLGYTNLEMPIATQRAAILREAKIQLQKSLLEKIHDLPISGKQTVHDLSVREDSLEICLTEYARGFIILDSQFISRDSMTIAGFVLTNQIKTCVTSSLSSN